MAMLTVNGIDVSKWQGDIDWIKVKDSGKEFAFIKIGNCLKNGNLTLDPKFTTNIKGALAAGLKVGVYAYMYTRTVDTATIAAQNVVAALATSKELLTLPVACDMEEVNVANTGRANCTSMAAAWRDVMRSAGLTPALYCNPNWLKNYITRPDDMSLWLAHYTSKPYCASDYWQYSDKGKVPGINDNVDLNYGYVAIPNKAVKEVDVDEQRITSAKHVDSKPYDTEDALEYLSKAGWIDSPELWRNVLSGGKVADAQKHIAPLLCKFAAAVMDGDHVIDELQDIVV